MTQPPDTTAASAPPITIRRATRADMPRMAAILYDDPPQEMKVVAGKISKARQIGALLLEHGLEADVGRTVLALVDAEPAGLMETTRPNDDTNLSILTMLQVLGHGVLIVGPQGLVRFLRFQSARSRVQIARAPGSFYIAELDVHPDHRNRGIGAALLRHGQREARAEGFARMSLTTTITNPAQHLYEREGYRVVATRRDARYERLTSIPGRVLMVKELT